MVKGRGPEPLQAAEKRLARDIDIALKGRAERAPGDFHVEHSPANGGGHPEGGALANSDGVSRETLSRELTPREHECALGAKSRVLAPLSTNIRTTLVDALKCFLKKGSFDRELYSAAVRALGDAGDKRLVAHLKAALTTDEAGGLATLSAACFVSDAALSVPLARAAASQKTQVSFAAEVARLCRGEPSGARLSALAPKVKEAHRISLCVDLLLPISSSGLGAVCSPMADALHVLRAAERHLGRWLVMAKIAHDSGDERPIREALDRSAVGPQSSRAAWAFVAWGLDPASTAPSARPTAETVARLSHRPSAEKDMSFLFRLGEARLSVAVPMLETLAKGRPLPDGAAVRASHVLARRFGQMERTAALAETAKTAPEPGLRGLAAAALFDVGDVEAATSAAAELAASEDLEAQIWSALIRESAGRGSAARAKNGTLLLDEKTYRRLHAGWLE